MSSVGADFSPPFPSLASACDFVFCRGLWGCSTVCTFLSYFNDLVPAFREDSIRAQDLSKAANNAGVRQFPKRTQMKSIFAPGRLAK